MTDDPVVEAFKRATDMSMENDRALLDLIDKVIERILELEKKVDYLLRKQND